jgi:hypothetical protein
LVATNTIKSRDLVLGTLIAVVFTVLSSGSSLLVTFVPAIAVTWVVFVLMYYPGSRLPDARSFLPAFFTTLALQFIHFGEEFAARFTFSVPELYSGSFYDADLFMWVHMISYAAFIPSGLLLCYRRKGFLLVPALFFTIHGAIGNAVSHTFWVLYLGTYVPGFFTALAYLICGPWLLFNLLGSRSDTAAVTIGFGTLQVLLLSAFSVQS